MSMTDRVTPEDDAWIDDESLLPEAWETDDLVDDLGLDLGEPDDIETENADA